MMMWKVFLVAKKVLRNGYVQQYKVGAFSSEKKYIQKQNGGNIS